MADYDYDLFVVGGGSGGVRAARLAGGLGKRVAIAEEYRYGGTCVIRGCVPKKLFVYAAQFPEHFSDADGYGWTMETPRFDWRTLIANKDREISRLEGIYREGLETAGVETLHSRAELVDRHTVRICATGRTVTAEYILLAVGGKPDLPTALTGHELCISSDEAFHLEELPRSIVIAGAGYIGVEFANIFHGLGVETTIVYRGAEILSRFDKDLRRMLHKEMEAKGIRILCHDVLEKVERMPSGQLGARTVRGQTILADQIMLALGRVPNTERLGLAAAGVAMDDKGAVVVDAFSRTSMDNIYAVGDVSNRLPLTPVAIHEAMCFVETVFRGNPVMPNHELVATAVFSQPEIGTVGLSEDEAAKRYACLEVYRAEFRPLKHTLTGKSERMLMKLLVNGADRQVVGAHILGAEAGEMAQLLGIALKGGVTKDTFDRTMALHPTAGEELVTMYRPTYVLRDGELEGSGAMPGKV